MWVLLWIDGALASGAIDVEHPGGAPRVVLDVGLSCGSLSVRGADRRTVRITGTMDDPDAIEVDVLDGRVSVAVGSGDCARLVVHVPRATAVRAETASATLQILDVDGEVVAITDDAPITIGGAPSAVSATSGSGAIAVVGPVAGGLDVQTVSGPIRIDGAAGRVRADSVSGPIAFETDGIVHELHARTLISPISVSAMVSFRGAWTLDSHTGALSVVLPERTSAALRWETQAGSVHVDDVDRATFAEELLGGGEARIALGTFTGPIRIEQRDLGRVFPAER